MARHGHRSFHKHHGIGVFRSAENAPKLGPIMKAHLQPEGLLVNHKKSNWDPTPSLSRLRFSYDAISRVISVPEGKLDKFVNERNRILGQKAVSETNCIITSRPATCNAKSLRARGTAQVMIFILRVNDCLLTSTRTFEVDLDPYELMSGHARTFGVTVRSHVSPMRAHARTLGVDFDPHEPMSGHARTFGVSVCSHDSPMAAHARTFEVNLDPHEPMSGHARTFGVSVRSHDSPMAAHARTLGVDFDPHEPMSGHARTFWVCLFA